MKRINLNVIGLDEMTELEEYRLTEGGNFIYDWFYAIGAGAHYAWNAVCDAWDATIEGATNPMDGATAVMHNKY
jgi:hypothetical protein